MIKALETHPASVLRDVIERFVEAARQRGEYHVHARRRSRRRYHRSWPLSVSPVSAGLPANAGSPADVDQPVEATVALHNASQQGIAFLAPRAMDPGAMLLVKLFWHDDDCPRVPAVVRHCTSTKTGYLVGCEFLVWEEDPAGDEWSLL